jgi:hypothetical protein
MGSRIVSRRMKKLLISCLFVALAAIFTAFLVG